jgi:hypothetical protein
VDVTLRPVNDEFLERVVFPSLELGAAQARPAFEALLNYVSDEKTRGQLELLSEQCASEPLWGLRDERWCALAYHLLFSEWHQENGAWGPVAPWVAFAAPWGETLHLALMLDDPTFPYADAPSAEAAQRAFWEKPRRSVGLASLLCGAWEAAPRFPPERILTTTGPDPGPRQGGLVRSTWSWRPMLTVAQWAARLPSALSQLLEREVQRLRPVEALERHAILDYWLGREAEPPMLAVCFSGLGPRSFDWITEIGSLAHLIRAAAGAQRGLTAVLSQVGARGDDQISAPP